MVHEKWSPQWGFEPTIDTGGMLDNSKFKNSKLIKTDYVRRLQGMAFEKHFL
jgi:hypothetical protein